MFKIASHVIHSALTASVIVGGLTTALEAGELRTQSQHLKVQKPQQAKTLKKRSRTGGSLRLKQHQASPKGPVYGTNNGADLDFDYAIRTAGPSLCTYQSPIPATVRFKVRNYGSQKPTQNLGVFVQFYNANLTPGVAVASSVAPINPGQETLVQLSVPDGVVQNYGDGAYWKFQIVVNLDTGAVGGMVTEDEDNLANNVMQGSCSLMEP